MRYLVILLFCVTGARFAVAEDPLTPTKFLQAICDAHLANLVKIDCLSISAIVRFDWSDPKSTDTATVLAHWIPSNERFLSTDPFPNERENSWKKRPITIALLFGGADGVSPPWKLFERLQKGHVSIRSETSTPDVYIVSAHYTNGDGPRLFVDWYLKKEHCFYPHYVVEKIGNDKNEAALTRESKFSYEKINGTVLPKMVISKSYDRVTGALIHRKTVVVNRIEDNSEREFHDTLTPNDLTEE